MTPSWPYLVVDVLLEDGREWFTLACDQRDQHRALMPPVLGGAGISSPELDPLGFLRGTGWACLTRRGELRTGDDLSAPLMTYAQFDAVAVFVQPVADDVEVDPAVGPTWPDPGR